MDYYEIIGFVTGLACVYLNAKQNIWGWPIAMISVVMYAVVFFNAKLYGDAALQVFFFILICYGLYEWLKKDDKNESIKPQKSTELGIIYSLASTALLTGILAGFLGYYTDSDVPGWDALTTSMSIVAQILLARKKIANWIYWIVVDVIYVGIYIYKDLYLTAILYFIFIPLAAYGYYEWKKEMNINHEKIN
jgi:nicotinamide mononucleotide transporter